MMRRTSLALVSAAGMYGKSKLPSTANLRRKLKKLKKEERRLNRVKTEFDAWKRRSPDQPYDLDILPKNRTMENSLANMLLTRNDARAKLEFIKALMDSTLISLASPISTQWDPYDIKPQAFALDTYMALPMFTSLQYLRSFCAKYEFEVRDPAGHLWTESKEDRLAIEAGSKQRCSPDAPNKSWTGEMWQEVENIRDFDIKKATPLNTYGNFVMPHFIGYFGDLKTVLHNLSIVPDSVDIVVNPTSPLEFVVSREIMNTIVSNNADHMLAKCYKRVETALRAEFQQFFSEHCPEVTAAYSVCLPRTDESLSAEQIENANELNTTDDKYEITILIDSFDFMETMRMVKQGKDSGHLVGHRVLHLLQYHDAPPHMREGGSIFYDYESLGGKHEAAMEKQQAEEELAKRRRMKRRRAGYGFYQTSEEKHNDPQEEAEIEELQKMVAADPEKAQAVRRPRGVMGFVQVGETKTIRADKHVVGGSTGWFADPEMRYTEAWSVNKVGGSRK